MSRCIHQKVMDLNHFYLTLLDGDPSKSFSALNRPGIHGFFNTEPNARLFLETLVLGLYTTFDQETRVFHDTLFVIPKPLEAFSISMTERIVRDIRDSRSSMPKEERISGGKLIVAAFKHLHTGSRILHITTEPERWVAFGFGASDAMPNWMRKGLVDPNG